MLSLVFALASDIAEAVSEPLAFVSLTLAAVADLLALVSEVFALVSDTLAALALLLLCNAHDFELCVFPVELSESVAPSGDSVDSAHFFAI